ncbi:secretory phospholipase A2 receptor-like [Sinocyclocheilus grahami]|uniref:secretory phospholipase A2 receptor-like n=1 Tax=Sinocyclocheilus grahami TaxID=75366 RepID=UPI0007ACB5EE|nr:PREDICTED: secretory phospholipase A2 receptor-like [Sinocyclocheilus grahami]
MKTTLALLLIMALYCLSSGLKQHFFVNEQKKWFCAQKYCKTYFHGLSTFINASEEQRFLANASGQASDAWVGLHKKPETGVWKWSGGIDAEQISWDPAFNQPNNLDNENCGFLYKTNNKLHGEKCSITKPFFCMTNFVLVHHKETWDGALEYCRTHYNNLASLSTADKMNSALLEITQAETVYVWTGLHYLAGDWLWVTGDDLDYTAWYQNEQPQCPARDLRCGALDKQTKLWTHRNCEEKLSFFCL